MAGDIQGAELRVQNDAVIVATHGHHAHRERGRGVLIADHDGRHANRYRGRQVERDAADTHIEQASALVAAARCDSRRQVHCVPLRLTPIDRDYVD